MPLIRSKIELTNKRKEVLEMARKGNRRTGRAVVVDIAPANFSRLAPYQREARLVAVLRSSSTELLDKAEALVEKEIKEEMARDARAWAAGMGISYSTAMGGGRTPSRPRGYTGRE